MASKIRQNFSEECEALINKQINMELYASYVYLEMVTFHFQNAISNDLFSL
jgi:ferritin heavy chain